LYFLSTEMVKSSPSIRYALLLIFMHSPESLNLPAFGKTKKDPLG